EGRRHRHRDVGGAGAVRRRPPRPLLQEPVPPPGQLPDLRTRAVADSPRPPPRCPMPFAAALSTAPTTAAALAGVCDQAAPALPGPADLAMAFFSPHHAAEARLLAAELRRRLAPRALLGAVAEAVIGLDREVEGGPALALWLGKWDRPVRLTPFHL